MDFLDRSPTCFHSAETVAVMLRAAGYQALQEAERWSLQPGKGYYVVRGDASVIAFHVPQVEPVGFMISATHSDSPTLRLREEAERPSAGDCVRLSVEAYGGGIYRSWLDRPLSVAGRVMVRCGDEIRRKLVCVDRDLLIIPSVAIHMDTEVNQKGGLNPAVDLLPLFSQEKETGAFRRLIAQEAGVTPEDLLATELYLYPRTKATLLGANEEFLAAPRLDDQLCVFGALEGFLAAEAGDSIPVFAMFHNEEVGSATAQGADSTFLTDVLSRIAVGLGWDEEKQFCARANSFLLSADNAHAVHPAHPEYADGNEAPKLNGGVVLKYNANQRYITDALSAAVVEQLCRQQGISLQRYSNRADLPGGSTLGKLSSTQLSVAGADIGLAQLAMHSSYEVAGSDDLEQMVKLMRGYFAAGFRCVAEGAVTV